MMRTGDGADAGAAIQTMEQIDCVLEMAQILIQGMELVRDGTLTMVQERLGWCDAALGWRD